MSSQLRSKASSPLGLSVLVRLVLAFSCFSSVAYLAFAQLVETRFTIDESGVVSLSYFGSDEAYYTVYKGDSLEGVFTIKDIVLGEAKIVDFDDSVTPNQSIFYRIDEIPLSRPLDLDRDGIDDAFELAHPTLLDPLNPDDADLDSDGDNVSNFEEYVRGTDIAAISNLAPTVSLLLPVSGSGYLSPGQVELLALASDEDGQIVMVEFFEGNNKIGEDAVAPFAFSWQGVAAGDYVLTAKAIDDDGSSLSTFGSLVSVIAAAGAPLTRVVELSPSNGQGGIAVTRETVLRFSNPLAENTVIDADALSVTVGGEEVAARFVLSKDLKVLTVFYDQNLPANAKVELSFDGSLVNDLAGRAVDADADDAAGGVLAFFFNTLSVASFSDTSVCGRVFASLLESGNAGGSINVPLAGVKITVDGREDELFAFTDQFGDFRLDNAPAGRFFVHIDGREVVRLEDGIRFPDMGYYPFVGKTWESVPGEETTIGEVFLPLVNAATLQEVSGTEATLIDFPLDVLRDYPEFKDVKMEVPADSLFADNGARGGRVGIAPVPPDRLPGTLPANLDFPIVITVQTDGATNFDVPAPICFPNLPNPTTGVLLGPGEKSALVSFNHDAGRWEVVGPMTVSEDGSLVCTDPGVGILAPGWHGVSPGTSGSGGELGDGDEEEKEEPEAEEEQECKDNEKKGECTCQGFTSNTVMLHSGEEVLERSDLYIPGRGDLNFEMRRTYRSRLNYDGPIGFGWTFVYDEGLFVRDNGDITRSDSNAHLDSWILQGDGSYLPPNGQFRDLTRLDDGTYLLRDPDGFQRYYRDDGRLFCYQDRFDNIMLFDYDKVGNLSTIIDVFGREIDFEFEEFPDGVDRLTRVRDFIGREIVYSYDSEGNLISVRSPIVTGTSTGNDFANGRTEQYTYSSGFSESSLNHNLLSCTMPEEVASGGEPAMQWTFGNDINDPLTFDKVITETIGGTNASGVSAGGSRFITYEKLNEAEALGQLELPRGKATVTERNGNVREYFVNELNHHIMTRELTRGLRDGEPLFHETRSEFTDDGLLLRRIYPEGNQLEFKYDEEGPRLLQSSRIERRLIADDNRGGGEDLVTTYTYEPLYARMASMTDPRGNSGTFVPPLGEASPARYTTRFFYDYQESNDPIESATLFGIDLSAVPRGLGDLNGDGRVDQVFGNSIRIEGTSVLLRDGSNLSGQLGSTEQAIVTEYQWNDYGQMLALIDEEGNVTEYKYFPENDPDGDSQLIFSPYLALGNESKGYLSEIVSDAALTPRRQSATEPLALRSKLWYDPAGNIVATLDPRGVYNDIEFNQLNEVVSTTRGSSVNLATETGQLITGESALAYTSRFTYDFNGRVVLSEIENRDGNSLGVGDFVEGSYIYDILDNIVLREMEVDDVTSIIAEFSYDGNENLVLTRKPEGNEVAVSYDERDLVFEVTRGAGNVDASTIRFDYDGNKNRTRILDAEDNNGDGDPEALTYVYDGFNRVAQVVDALGSSAVNEFDSAGNILQTQVFGHPAGQPDSPNVLHEDIRYAYDELNRRYQMNRSLFVADGFDPVRVPLLSDGNSDGFVTDFYEYDALSRLTFSEEDDGEVTEYQFDGLSRRILELDALGNGRSIEYDANSNPVLVSRLEKSENNTVSEEVFQTRYVYDQFNRLTRATDNAGQTTRFAYDSRNNIVSKSDPVGPIMDDPLGLFPGQINGPGNTKSYLYDGLNRRIAEVSDLRLGGVGNGELDTTNSFNGDGMITLVYEWDDNSRLSAIEDDNGNRTTYAYDALDRQIRQTNANTDEVTSKRFDRDHNLVELIDPNETVSFREYDALNRLVSVDIDRGPGVEGTISELFEYDGLNRRTLEVDDNGGGGFVQEAVYVYDSLGRALEERQNGQALSSSYTGSGNRVGHIYPGGRTLSQSFDSIDRVNEIRDITGGGNDSVVDLEWIGPDYRLLRHLSGNGTELTFLNDSGDALVGYDAIKRIQQFRVLDAGNDEILNREYGYNQASMRLFEQRNDDDALIDSYVYDSVYRVAQTNLDEGGSVLKRNVELYEYTYDGVGNRRNVLEESDSQGLVDVAYEVNEMNEYTSAGGVFRVHSSNGNLVDDGERLYIYDYKNRLIEVADKVSGDTVANYFYHADNRRSLKVAGGGETRYFYDGWQVCEEQNGSGETLLSYVYSPNYIDAPVQLSRTEDHPLGSGDVYLHRSAGYDVVAVTDESGAVSERRFYNDFGQAFDQNKVPVFTSSVGNPYGFQGRRLDEETGLYYYRNRYYDSSTGRFLQRDPVWDSGNVGNQYTYVGNSPINGLDPLGLDGSSLANDDSILGPQGIFGAGLNRRRLKQAMDGNPTAEEYEAEKEWERKGQLANEAAAKGIGMGATAIQPNKTGAIEAVFGYVVDGVVGFFTDTSGPSAEDRSGGDRSDDSSDSGSGTNVRSAADRAAEEQLRKERREQWQRECEEEVRKRKRQEEGRKKAAEEYRKEQERKRQAAEARRREEKAKKQAELDASRKATQEARRKYEERLKRMGVDPDEFERSGRRDRDRKSSGDSGRKRILKRGGRWE
ncbi:MAG: RHS repeat-associated protein [Candidatus Pelagisphaera sp.]|jgi:RHS repeat-associated protein